MKQRVGFMGLGIMGSAMAANICRAGYPLVVYNRTQDKARALAQLEAEVASSPKVLAEKSEIIVTMVTGPEAIDALLWSSGGAAEALGPGKTLINMSSVSPRYTRELGRVLKRLGVNFIDAPVSGTRKPAEDGTLLILAGGSKSEIDACQPLLLTMGKQVVYCGEAGQGSMMKMTVNLLLGHMMEALSEALCFGRHGGLATHTILDVVQSGPLNCGLYQIKADMLKQDDYPVSFPLKHMTKDLKYAVDTAYETGAPLPGGQTMLHLYRVGVERHWGDLDFAAIMKVLQHLGAGQ